MTDILKKVAEAHPQRSDFNLDRRIMKIGEELGELNEAYLNITGQLNLKKKSWDDVREEAVDVAIIALDVALTVLDTDPGVTIDDDPISHQVFEPQTRELVYQKVIAEFDRKLAKWREQLKLRYGS